LVAYNNYLKNTIPNYHPQNLDEKISQEEMKTQ
jgi:hypothetical protein